ncbi:MAG: TSUP family transporter [Bdellovibrionales bacterium]|nr:TSUP family transporter [Bdellovibrionales bacterium]
MDSDLLLLSALIIAVCSVVQSIFGTGLLVYGTPSLLLLGFSFAEALLLVLPASLVISVLQTHHGWSHIHDFRRSFLYFSAPPLIGGLLVALALEGRFDLKFPIGVMLLLSGIIRFSPFLVEEAKLLLRKHSRIYLVCMGAVHGLTNMGGALLTIYVNGLHHDKEEVRAHIAFAYAIFIILQLLVLFATGASLHLLLPALGYFPVLAFVVYHIIGHRLFQSTSNEVFYLIMSLLMLSFGVLLLFFA